MNSDDIKTNIKAKHAEFTLQSATSLQEYHHHTLKNNIQLTAMLQDCDNHSMWFAFKNPTCIQQYTFDTNIQSANESSDLSTSV